MSFSDWNENKHANQVLLLEKQMNRQHYKNTGRDCLLHTHTHMQTKNTKMDGIHFNDLSFQIWAGECVHWEWKRHTPGKRFCDINQGQTQPFEMKTSTSVSVSIVMSPCSLLPQTKEIALSWQIQSKFYSEAISRTSHSHYGKYLINIFWLALMGNSTMLHSS